MDNRNSPISYNITEERISNEAKPVEYVVSLPLFTNGMDTNFPPGQKVEGLVDFHFLDSKFSLSIYPTGLSEDDEGFVSIFLVNENKYDVFVNCELKMGRHNRSNFKVQNERIPARLFIGHHWLFDHELNREFYKDHDPEVTCRITKVWKQLRTDDTVKSEFKLLKETKRGIEDLWCAHDKVIRRLTRLDEDVDERLASIESTQDQIREQFVRHHCDNMTAIIKGPFMELFSLMRQESQKNREDIVNSINEIGTKMKNLEERFNNLENCVRLNNCGQGAEFLAEKIQPRDVIDVDSENDTTDKECFSSDNEDKC